MSRSRGVPGAPGAPDAPGAPNGPAVPAQDRRGDSAVDNPNMALDMSGCDLAHDPLARRARKRALPVTVEFAAQAGVLHTLEGPVHYRSGDALLTGIAGERWPIRRARFETRYQPVAATNAGQAGCYLPRAVVVRARQMGEAFQVRVGEVGDCLLGRAGDWLLQYGAGDYGIVAGALFVRSYELLDDDPPGTPATR